MSNKVSRECENAILNYRRDVQWMFQTTDTVVLNKIKLFPYTDFNLEVFYKEIKTLNT
jgi:Ni2+-binding GTPase involved in maturation of urease and hydrogenase